MGYIDTGLLQHLTVTSFTGSSPVDPVNKAISHSSSASTKMSTDENKDPVTLIISQPALQNLLPKTFHHGYASASYQIEGGHASGGRLPSVWDDYLHRAKKEDGDTACDSYHLWRDDIELLKKYGCNSYRFSISWSRVIPLGGKDDPVNEEGVKYYSNLVSVGESRVGDAKIGKAG